MLSKINGLPGTFSYFPVHSLEIKIKINLETALIKLDWKKLNF